MSKVYQILTGYIRCNIKDRFGRSCKLLLTSPTVENLFEGEELYEESYKDALKDGLFSDEQYLDYILKRELWTLEEEKILKEIPKEIEDLKLSMFESLTRSNTKDKLRKKLQQKKDELSSFFNKKYNLNYLTADGVASMSKNYFLVGKCLLNSDKTPFNIDYDEPNAILDEILIFRNRNKISEREFREIVRNEPWRTYWSCGNPFGKASIDLTEDQRTLIIISKMYDNIYESPECPSQEILEDDDVLDGWIIKQRRKREASQLENQGEQLTGSHKNADMVFIPAETQEDADRIHNLNSPTAKMTKERRINEMKGKGEIREQDFFDQKLRIMNEMAKMK